MTYQPLEQADLRVCTALKAVVKMLRLAETMTDPDAARAILAPSLAEFRAAVDSFYAMKRRYAYA